MIGDYTSASQTGDGSTTGTSETGSVQDTMSDEVKSGSDDSDSLEGLDALEDLQKLIVGEAASNENEEGAAESKGEIEDSEYKVTDEELDEEGRVRQELLQKEKEEALLAKEDEVKKEEERRDRMKVLLSGYLELKAKKEIEKALLNEKKIIAQWLYPFRETYQKEWQLEMTKLKLAFQKALDYKKAHIHAIQRERKLCELNHLWADCAHYQISEELFEFMRKRCEKLKEKYLQELEETKKYYLEREQQILEKCSKAEERAKLLGNLRKNIQENILKQTKEALEQYKHQGEFLKDKEMELIEAQHMTYVEKIAHELQTSISPTEHRIEEVRGIFNEWKEKYDSFSQIFAKNKKEIQAVSDEIPDLERRVAAARKKLDDMRKESKRQQQIQMEEVLQLQKESKKYEKLGPSMRKMISDSEEVMVQLRDRKSKLERIKKLKKFCDQLESECDRMGKDIPYIDPLEQEELKQGECLTFIRDLCTDDFEDQSLLDNLNRKVSKVKLQKQILQHDLEKLKVENMALKSDMKKYLQNISSGEWEMLPEELQLGDGPKPSVQEAVAQTKKLTEDDLVKLNLELLRKKCHPVNSKIVSKVEKKFGKIK